MYTTERRKVSDAKWYNPLTWKNHHFEVRRVWDMDYPVRSKQEIELLLKDMGGPTSQWEIEK